MVLRIVQPCSQLTCDMARHVSTAQFKHSDRPMQYSCTRVPLTTHSHFPALDQTYQNQSVLRPPQCAHLDSRTRRTTHHTSRPLALPSGKAKSSTLARKPGPEEPRPSTLDHATHRHLKRINSYRYRKITPAADRPNAGPPARRPH